MGVKFKEGIYFAGFNRCPRWIDRSAEYIEVFKEMVIKSIRE
jgi:hypothetical protein